ncbi:hypothetical protein RF11_08005 [Thelohanellus kitauei]|uniref:Uncharacterized protein n=1 Tax=Thelohanellus kitauei TaxID=669202 RepID=A0A0C2MLE4_THEKT|nr:hypothetical protein RF11_08005 [Thelohanellus kitauei]
MFQIAKAILDRSYMNAANSVTAINVFAMSHLCFIAPMLQLSATDTRVIKEKLSALFLNKSLLVEGKSTGRIFLPKSLDGLGLVDPTTTLHQMLKSIVALIDSPPDEFVNAAVRLMRCSCNYARHHASYEDKLRQFVASIEGKLPESVHPALARNSRIPELKLLHASAICLRRESSSLQKHWFEINDQHKADWLKTNFLVLLENLAGFCAAG